MSSNEHFRQEPVNPELEPGLANELINEASRTMSGLPRDFDPRYEQALAEEQERLRQIADNLRPPNGE